MPTKAWCCGRLDMMWQSSARHHSLAVAMILTAKAT